MATLTVGTWTIYVSGPSRSEQTVTGSTLSLPMPTIQAKFVDSARNNGYATIQVYPIVDGTPTSQMIGYANGGTPYNVSGSGLLFTCTNNTSNINTSEIFTANNKTENTVTITKYRLIATQLASSYYDGRGNYTKETTITGGPWDIDIDNPQIVTLNAPPDLSSTTIKSTTSSGIFWTKDAAGASNSSIRISPVKLIGSSTVASFQLDMGGGYVKNYGASDLTGSITYTIPIAPTGLDLPAGTYTPTVTVTDSRGKTTTRTFDPITVQQYDRSTYDISSLSKNTNEYIAGSTTVSVTVSNFSSPSPYYVDKIRLKFGTLYTEASVASGQTSVTVSHTLTEAGKFKPDVYIRDTRGLWEHNYFPEIVVADANYVAPSCSYNVTTSSPYYVGATPYTVSISDISVYETTGNAISSITLNLGSQNISRTTAGTLSITPSATGSITPTIVVKDIVGGTTTYTLSSVVINANTVPTCTATVTSSAPYRSDVNWHNSYSVAITDATAYNSKTISSITLTVGSQTATISGNGTLTVPTSANGTFTPEVVITDNIGATNTYTLSSITVSSHPVPTFNAATSTSGNYYAGVTNYSVSITNATASDSASIVKTRLEIGTQYVEGTGNGTLTIKVSTAGTFTPTVTVTDSYGALTTTSMSSLTVRANQPPSATVTVSSSSPYCTNASARTYSVTISNATAYEAKSITQTKLTVGAQSVTGSGNGTLSIPSLASSGTYTPVVTITDNQGAVTTYTQTAITVEDNIASISSLSAIRIDSSTFLPTDEGTNAVVTATFSYTRITGNYLTQPAVAIDGTPTNNVTWYTSWTSSAGFSGAVNWTNYQPNIPVTLYAKLTSTFGVSSTYSISVAPKTTYRTNVTSISTTLAQAFYLLAGKAGGHSLGIGKKPSADYMLDIGMTTNINSNLTVTQKFSTKYENSLITGGTSTAAVTTSPYRPLKWTFNKGINPANGDVVLMEMPSAGHDYGCFVSFDNGTTYHPICVQGHERLTTQYESGSALLIEYDSDWTCTNVYPASGGTSRTDVTGSWRCLNGGSTKTQCFCGTDAGTASKIGEMTDYTATANRYVMVNVVNANTSAGAITLNINGTGAKPIYINGSASSSSNYTLPAGSYLVFYDGTNYQFRTDGKIAGVNGVIGDGADYTNLTNKPSINSVTLSGNKTSEDLKISKQMTQAQYDALSSAEKNNGEIYFITDGSDDDILVNDSVPIGAIQAYGGTTAPNGWLMCDGSAVSRTTYSELFAAIGINYGDGDGSTTFNVPDLCGRVVTGAGTADGVTYILGDKVDAGVPNITGEARTNSTASSLGASNVNFDTGSGSGAIRAYISQTSIKYAYATGGYYGSNIGFDASGSDIHYGASDTVQPNTTVANYIIKAKDFSLGNAHYDSVYNQAVAEAEADLSNELDDLFDEKFAVAAQFLINQVTYSTTEKQIGWWINGKPLYRITLTGTSTSGGYTINVSSLSIDSPVSLNISVNNTTGNTWVFDSYIQTSGSDSLNAYMSADKKSLYLRSGSSYSFGAYSVTLEYTKTTDTV